MKLNQIKRQNGTVIITLVYPYKILGIFPKHRVKHYIFVDPKSEKFRWLSYPDYSPLELDDFMVEYLNTLHAAYTKGMIKQEDLENKMYFN